VEDTTFSSHTPFEVKTSAGTGLLADPPIEKKEDVDMTDHEPRLAGQVGPPADTRNNVTAAEIEASQAAHASPQAPLRHEPAEASSDPNTSFTPIEPPANRACHLFVALRMLAHVSWTGADSNDSLDYALMREVAADAVQTRPDLYQAIRMLIGWLFPDASEAIRNNKTLPLQDALETYQHLCERLLQPQYAYSRITSTIACAHCLNPAVLEQNILQINAHSFYDINQDEPSMAITLGQLVTDGLAYVNGTSCSTCKRADIRDCIKITALADILIVDTQRTETELQQERNIRLPHAVPRTRGGYCTHLQLQAIVWYRAKEGDQHYVLQEFIGQHHTSVYDPLAGRVNNFDFLNYQPRSCLYKALQATDLESGALHWPLPAIRMTVEEIIHVITKEQKKTRKHTLKQSSSSTSQPKKAARKTKSAASGSDKSTPNSQRKGSQMLTRHLLGLISIMEITFLSPSLTVWQLQVSLCNKLPAKLQ
jgi:hypothetical protein